MFGTKPLHEAEESIRSMEYQANLYLTMNLTNIDINLLKDGHCLMVYLGDNLLSEQIDNKHIALPVYMIEFKWSFKYFKYYF